MTEAKSGKMITVEQLYSAARRPRDQRATLVGLGLNKRHKRAILQDTPSIRGMIVKAKHLVRVIE